MNADEITACCLVAAYSLFVLVWCGYKAFYHERKARRGDEDD